MLEDLILIAATAIITGLMTSMGWLWKRKAEIKDRATDALAENDEKKRLFLQGRIDHRDRGFEKLVAFADGMQFLRTDAHVQQKLGSARRDHEALEDQALALFHDGNDEVLANIGSTAPFAEVREYLTWLFITKHPPGQTPGVYEYEAFREIVLRCKRICQNIDRVEITSGDFALSDDHEFSQLLLLTRRSGSQLVVSADGTMIATMDGPAMAQWMENDEVALSKWKHSRRLALRRMKNSGLYDEPLPSID